MKKAIAFADQKIGDRRGEWIRIASWLYDHPEVRFEEWESSAYLMKILEGEGFRVEAGSGGLPTAFTASFGSGKPVIGLLGEYDALPHLSQVSGISRREKREGGPDIGHGCGHHLLGTALLAAAITVKEYLLETGREGTIIYYGCPAEEGGSGKVWMAREGVFDRADVFFSWHPEQITQVNPGGVLATIVMEYAFTGTASHAAAAPHLGRSALEAAELMAVGMGFLREHLPMQARVHYAYVDAGGSATNVIQPGACVAYQIRSPRMAEALLIRERIDDLARGAALMTGTKAQIRFVRASSELRPNETLSDLLYEVLTETDRPPADKESLRLAEGLYETLPQEARGVLEEKILTLYGPDVKEGDFSERLLWDDIWPRHPTGTYPWASTDVGDISQRKPVGFFHLACFGKDIPLHSWQAVAFGKSSFAMEGMLTAARAIAAASIHLMEQPEFVRAAMEEWRRREEKEPYVDPTPEGAEPKIVKA